MQESENEMKELVLLFHTWYMQMFWEKLFYKNVNANAVFMLNFCYLKSQEESEVPDDETINQMIARSEEEFEIFQVRTCLNNICYMNLCLFVLVLPLSNWNIFNQLKR